MRLLSPLSASVLSTNAENNLLQLHSVHRKVQLGKPYASGLNRQVLSPTSPNVLATCVKLSRKHHDLARIVHAERGDGIILHPLLGRSQTDIGPVKMEVGQIFIKP